ncbi:2,3,4,5-tetrahydropyridine-2,6-dicarboxylate N-succinyltransferase [Buchnera aphidicola (Anoecia corni)]|uniref:2,3,4,5-tetrahydropyridine-2,6-dicarboxylate N-succinyltransferase n=1 Tax=Buchnera aphidicola (Anoecia corni) TaxID=2994477 RepID=A0AAT9IGH5_9GAMM
MENLKKIINESYEKKDTLDIDNIDSSISESIDKTISLLNSGTLRAAEKKNDSWIVNEWVKKAILLAFLTKENSIFHALETCYYDKIPLKYSDYDESQFQKDNVRIVPLSTVRNGAFIGKNSVLMPSYVNIGAYIGENSMIDTWSTIGSCAQIGNNVHISGGVGIGGVLEPIQSSPTIIEDNCFIGARSEIVEGVIVEEGSVISMGVYIGKSTKIYDRENDKIYYGRVPSQSVVVPGNLPSKNGKYGLYSAIIVKKVDHKTLSKVELNKLLRNIYQD